MPPKRAPTNYAAVVRSAQVAGLSNAAPSFRLQDPAVYPAASPVDQAFGVREPPRAPFCDFCNFCGRRAADFLVCEDCLAKVCVNTLLTSSRCISLPGTVSGRFRCPHCVRSVAKLNAQAVGEASFSGYRGRVHCKITWPLLLAHMAPVDTPLRRILADDLAHQYADQRENLFVEAVQLSPGGHAVSASRLQAGAVFDEKSFDIGSPANKFVVLETECDPATGGFSYGGAFGTVCDVLGRFLGERFRERLRAPATLPDPASKTLFQESAKARGGWRGLFLVTQGPWIHQGQRINDVVSLVREYVCSVPLARYDSHVTCSGNFDFVVALASDETTPAQSAAFLSTLVRTVGVDNATPSQTALPSLWGSFVRSLESCKGLVDSTPVVFVFRERLADATSPVTCRKVATHSPPYTAWGVRFLACGGPHACHVTQADIGVRNHRGDCVRTQCLKCGWKSKPANAQDFSQLVHPVFANGGQAFWHAFPPPPQLVSAFVEWSRQ